MSSPTCDPFRIDAIPRVMQGPMAAVLGIPALRRLYERARTEQPGESDPFERRILRALGIDADIAESDWASIPDRGPLVIAANHPHGALDGLLLLDIVRRVRRDVRMVANRLLERIPELHASCFFVDPFGGPTAAARSRAGLRAAHLWLRNSGALVVFPAGEVGHAWSNGALVDGEWTTTFERLAQSTGARLVRVFIDGRNSRLFYVAGRIHPGARTAMLGRELLRARGRTVRVRIGVGEDIADEIARLPDRACLLRSGSFRVFCAAAAEIPSTLREIGRLREAAFRAVGEGTGRDLDLDRFDRAYLHLFAWDDQRRQIVGAYRIGRSDRIASESGVDGLYTRTLFRYDGRLLTRLGAPALELGRSFVRPEYQQNYNALLLLWRGIGAFVAQNPQYRFLFGAVSISARYSDRSHGLLLEFLRQNHLDEDLAELVDAIRPAQCSAPDEQVPGSVEEVQRLIERYEADGKGMPVLLRQYLKLNARLLGVNVDRDFGDAIDALMVVDLTTANSGILQRYLGKRGYADVMACHAPTRAAHAA